MYLILLLFTASFSRIGWLIANNPVKTYRFLTFGSQSKQWFFIGFLEVRGWCFAIFFAAGVVNEPYEEPAATTRSCFVRRGSTEKGLVACHSPGRWPAEHSVRASASVPTGAATGPADPTAPWKAARLLESDFLPAVSESSRHLADHVPASAAPPLESLPDYQPGIRFPVLPSGSRTTASSRWLRSPRMRAGKLPHVVALVRESHFHNLPGFGVQHRQRLLASVPVTSYNSHLGEASGARSPLRCIFSTEA
jgi:hypothetical protein